jgi:hypothetical protein
MFFNHGASVDFEEFGAGPTIKKSYGPFGPVGFDSN